MLVRSLFRRLSRRLSLSLEETDPALLLLPVLSKLETSSSSCARVDGPLSRSVLAGVCQNAVRKASVAIKWSLAYTSPALAVC